ncbi:hypothetical protein HEP84_31670 [Streptomyces sp. RLB1-33]|uniref:hypothetical protein n=1 Tax=Streptomyces mirabilis TaxID=68239 RepID=UPI00143E2263|nr:MULTISPECIES: hypothetical protein [Streptomyces]QIY73023.1 hypothetical protein HEP84_31670 [Streptomyces sp. RLB1-33]QUW80010.1 hypothetical protein SMIR_13480 [Streptomyces mirabilis]
MTGSAGAGVGAVQVSLRLASPGVAFRAGADGVAVSTPDSSRPPSSACLAGLTEPLYDSFRKPKSAMTFSAVSVAGRERGKPEGPAGR